MKEKASRKDIVFLYGVLLAILLAITIPSLSLPEPCDSGHSWSERIKTENNCIFERSCSVCGKTETIESHDWIGATCQKPGICSRCGEEGRALSHEYAFGKCKSCRESEPFYTFTEDDNEDEFWFAVTSAQNLVKDELKSPSTAKFPWGDTEYTVKNNGRDWKVSGYVDAQNSFGAVVRTNWTAVFTMGDTSGSTYTVSNYDVTFP